MKYCDKCGTALKDDDCYCSECGAVCSTKENDPLQILDENNSVTRKNTTENIEQRVAKYYNDTYLSAEKTGKYVVLHDETTVSGDVCNVIVRYQTNEDFNNSDTGTHVADVSVNKITGDCTIHSKPIKKTAKRSGAHVFICVIAVIVMLNIVCVPFICNKFWSIEDINEGAYSFSDMIEEVMDYIHYGYSFYLDDEITILYYFGGLVCALFIFFSALGKSSGACAFGSLVGSGLSLYIFYQIYLGTTRYYVSGNNASLTFGYYVSCVGFISMLIASLHKEQG